MRILKILSIVLAIALVYGCNNNTKSSIHIEGSIALPVQAEVKLIYLGLEKATVVDSLKLSNELSFELNGVIEQPALFTLRVEGLRDIFLVLHPGDHINLDIDNATAPASYTVEGSTDSRLVNEIMTRHFRVRDEITQLSIEYEQSKRNSETFSANKIVFDSVYNNLLAEHKKETVEFIKRNPKSLAGIFALYQDFGKQRPQPLFNIYEDIEVFNIVDSNLVALYPLTEAVQALNRDVADIQKQIELKTYSDQLIEPGKKAPEFEVITTDGSKIRLSDYKGEPVVYLFFAVWNKESADNLIALNEFKSKYAYRDLKIIAISFDTDREKLQAFIESNSISIPVVCDYKYWDSEYVNQFGVQRIPDILLLNRSHIIYNRNLSSQELIQTLTEWKSGKLF